MLESSLNRSGQSYTPRQLDQLLTFVRLLEKWSKTFNLIGKQNQERIVSHHVLDSLSAMPYLRGNRMLDVGSGAGLPGIPLAVVRPDVHFVLLDSNGKKTRFMQQVIVELCLSDRVEVIKSRIEEYHPGHAFDTVISRAFASLGDFVKSSLHLCDQHSILLAMKGRRPDSELKTLSTDVKVIEVAAVSVPDVKAERHIVCLQKASD
ncbi:MAG: 16S rRNA (guanine(527)-N(7))-methyltransferase RsmG [Gammaproteobacteria bacterium]|nr:16S rRNA (guanine(527)-N(7))-methyltransferase RsmG [Gammaproteobacteria bacterium]